MSKTEEVGISELLDVEVPGEISKRVRLGWQKRSD